MARPEPQRHHPTWGHMIFWLHPQGMGGAILGLGREETGPYLIRGKSVDSVFSPARSTIRTGDATGIQPAASSKPGMDNQSGAR